MQPLPGPPCRYTAGRPPGEPTTLDHLLDLVDGHGEDDHRAGDDLLPERGDPHDDQAVGQEADHEGADDRAAHGAPAAGQGRTADDHGGDGVELVEGAEVGGGGADVGDLEDADDPRAQPGDDVDPDLHPLDRHAGQLGGKQVAAAGVDVPAEDELVHHRAVNQDQRRQDDQDDRGAAVAGQHEGDPEDEHRGECRLGQEPVPRLVLETKLDPLGPLPELLSHQSDGRRKSEDQGQGLERRLTVGQIRQKA